MSTLERCAARFRLCGLVQGVGFRPAVYRLATSIGLGGWVRNDGHGVLIHVEGTQHAVGAFRQRLQTVFPRAAVVESIVEESAHFEGGEFRIRIDDAKVTSGLVRVPADRATCEECQRDILDPANRRHHHAFATCTECGPRYSILTGIPYERHNTSMRLFEMCAACRQEYESEHDRRFHAEPIACPECGPRLRFFDSHTNTCEGLAAIAATREALRCGRTVALKGLGGYQLLVRADDEDAVARLRLRKRRPSKPFAVMAASIDDAERLACISAAERDALCVPVNPIVVLDSKNVLAASVAPGLRHVGVLLPTTPLHHLLVSDLGFPIVATSGNQRDEPIAFDDAGRERLASIADAFLDHDRRIVRQLDDSVIRVIDDQPLTMRLARGLAPCTLPHLERWAQANGAIPPVLAVGGQQKTAMAIWTGTQAILTQHLGDMDDSETRGLFHSVFQDVQNLYRCSPSAVACDLHPDYFTTRWARSSGLPVIAVQHHHAHAVACMAEYGWLDQCVIGVIFDGTGFGDDGAIWGGEILRATMADYQRIASLDLFALPGGEAAIREPNRIALSLLAETFGSAAIPLWLTERLGLSPARTRFLLHMIERDVQSPYTSSAGRLFDGVAALLLQTHHVSYEGEAALLLESVIDPEEESEYPIPIRLDNRGLTRGDWRPLVRRLVEDIASGVAIGVCAARFHNALVSWATRIVSGTKCNRVVLGGGCFQNAVLTSRMRSAFAAAGKNVHVPSRIPANDGGLAVGQLAVAMACLLRASKSAPREAMEDRSCVSAFPEESLSACR